MSALRASITRASAGRTFGAVGAQRSFQSCRVLAVGSESALHEENRAEKAEAQKQEQLAAQKQGKGEWKGELASDSESAVKADRHDIDSNKSIKEMQDEGAKKAQQEKKGQ